MMVCLFMFVSYLSLPYIIYKRRFRGNIAFVAFISCCNLLRESVRAAKLQKRHEIALGKDWKSDAEGECLNLG